VDIKISDSHHEFYVGERVEGQAEVSLPENGLLSDIGISFHCLAEVKWLEYAAHFLQSQFYHDKCEFHVEVAKLVDKDVTVTPLNENKWKTFTIPFSFKIPNDKNLPSSMLSAHAFVKYFVRVSIKNANGDMKHFYKNIPVQSPMNKNLMISVGGSAESSLLFHGGTVSMQASLNRKGFAPGQTLAVQVSVDNQTNALMKPQLELHQIQIYNFEGIRLKIVETVLCESPITGPKIPAHSKEQEILLLTIPTGESLSIRSDLITVKYFVNVILHTGLQKEFNLHINLPIVLTAKGILDAATEGYEATRHDHLM